MTTVAKTSMGVFIGSAGCVLIPIMLSVLLMWATSMLCLFSFLLVGISANLVSP